mgnify:CR=1 FL=1
MDRPGPFLFILLSLLLFSPVSRGEAADIAIIKAKNQVLYNEAITGFKVNCTGHKIVEYDMEENEERGHQITAKIKADKASLVFAVGAKAAVLAKGDIKEIPVIFSMVLNPETYGLDGGGNVAGVSLEIPVRIQLYTLKSIVPKVSKVGVIYNPKKTGNLIIEAKKAADEFGFALIASKADTKEDIPRALRAFAEGIDAYWMVPDPTLVTPEGFSIVLNYTFEKKVPFLAYSKAMVDRGALVSLAPNYASIGSQACSVANQIIQGATTPAQVSIASPKGLELTFNIKTAKQIGVENIATNAVTFAAREGYKISVSE